MRARAVAPTMLALVAAGPAWAADPSASYDLYVGGGYDTNLFLQIAAAPDSPSWRPYRGWFARLAPGGVAALAGDSLRLELRAGCDLRRTFGSGTLFLEEAQLALVRPELGPVDVRVAATAGRFDATVDSSLQFWTAGGSAQTTWRALDDLRAIGGARLGWRWFGAPATLGVDRDRTWDVELRVAYVPRPWSSLALVGDYLDLRSRAAGSVAGDGHLQRVTGGLDAGLSPARWVSLYASLWAGTLRSNGATSDRQVGGAVAMSLPLSEWLDATVRYDFLGDARAAGAGGADYQRHVVAAGLAAHGGTLRPRFRSEATPGAGASASVSGNAGGSAEGGSIEGPALPAGNVRFRLRAPGASRVAVIGSWNGWEAGGVGQALRRTGEPDMWQATVAVGPGEHRYRFVVDGRMVRPPDAARYRRDDFGGEDGVIDVPEAPQGAQSQ